MGVRVRVIISTDTAVLCQYNERDWIGTGNKSDAQDTPFRGTASILS